MLLYIQVKHREDSFNTRAIRQRIKSWTFMSRFISALFHAKNKKDANQLTPLLLFYPINSKHPSMTFHQKT